jgi:ABC-type sulfate transport system permease component
MGMVFTIVSFAVLTGPPIAGLLIEKKGGQYDYAQIFAAVAMLIGAGLLTAARIAQSRTLMTKL